MTPRPRSVDNAIIIEHACQLLIDRGRDAVTFGQVAQRCGLAAPTLVQRFATRDDMLSAVSRALADQLAAVFAVRGPSPLAALEAGLRRAAPLVSAAISLGPHAGADRFCLELRKQISYGLASAIEEAELPRCDVAQLARTIQISVAGAVATARLEGGDASVETALALRAQLATYI
ncbi:MAG TPA: helix-turn-helix domain-containing protein [Longimicrobiales bacterium]